MVVGGIGERPSSTRKKYKGEEEKNKGNDRWVPTAEKGKRKRNKSRN
jgi:hypothetical protein